MSDGTLQTVEQVVKEFGGVQSFAKQFGCTDGQVRNWLWREKFSHQIKPRLLMEAQQRGWHVAPHLVGLEAAE